jgi:hypothetical protein
MRIVRTTRIAIRTDERLLIRMSAPPLEGWCEACRATVQWLALDHAATVASVNPSALGRWVDEGRVHHGKIPGGSLLICLTSLVRQIHE